MAIAGSLVRDVLEQERRRCHHGCRSTKVSRGSNRVREGTCSYLSVWLSDNFYVDSLNCCRSAYVLNQPMWFHPAWQLLSQEHGNEVWKRMYVTCRYIMCNLGRFEQSLLFVIRLQIPWKGWSLHLNIWMLMTWMIKHGKTLELIRYCIHPLILAAVLSPAGVPQLGS